MGHPEAAQSVCFYSTAAFIAVAHNGYDYCVGIMTPNATLCAKAENRIPALGDSR
jgi:hypothetical protein